MSSKSRGGSVMNLTMLRCITPPSPDASASRRPEGTLWPTEIHIDGEAWVMSEVIEAGSGFTVREYVQTERLSPGQRLFQAI